MCGIAGAIGQFDGGLEKSVRAMNDAQIHRGPDDAGVWTSGSARGGMGCVLGHRRLSIVDLSPLGHQPMVDSDTGCAISYNGEIYNFLALREELELAGHRFASRCDTEVLLRAWIEWGEDCLERLEGMFAFALWEPRRKAIFLARDRMGIKPAYYAVVGSNEASGAECFLFASELRALLATGRIGRRLDPVALQTFVQNGFVVGPNTIVAGIRQLPAGSVLRVGVNGQVEKLRRYWSLPDETAGAVDPDSAVEQVRERLEAAVTQRLVSDVPLGIFLSGGIDSSAVASLAQSTSDSPITTFNIRFDEAQYDESVHAAAVARAIQSDHREVTLSETSFIDGLPDALASLDQPTFDAVNTYFVSRSVREAGLTVALAGTGGDELFGGYRSFRDLPRARRLLQAIQFIPEGARGHLGDALLWGRGPRGGGVPPQTRWGKLRDLIASDGSLLELYQISSSLFTNQFLDALIAKDSESVLVAGLPPVRGGELGERVRHSSDLHGVSQLELTLFLGERLLRDTDAASMAVSLEVRVPFVDHRLIEAVAALPESRRFQPLGKKALLRQLGTAGIDPKIFDRPKAGFELPFDVWCRNRLRKQVGETLLDPTLCKRVGLDPVRVENLWTAFCDDRPGIYWSRIWALFVLMWWSREYDIGL